MTFSTTPGSTGQIHRPQSRVLTTESRPVLLYTTPKNLFINDITTFTRVLRLKELIRDSTVLCEEIIFDIETLAGLTALRAWLVQCQ